MNKRNFIYSGIVLLTLGVILSFSFSRNDNTIAKYVPASSQIQTSKCGSGGEAESTTGKAIEKASCNPADCKKKDCKKENCNPAECKGKSKDGCKTKKSSCEGAKKTSCEGKKSSCKGKKKSCKGEKSK